MAQVTLGRHTAASRNPWTGTTSADARTVCVQTLHELQGSGEDFELLLNILTEHDAQLEANAVKDPETGAIRSIFYDKVTGAYDKKKYAKWQQRQLSGIRSQLNRYADRFGYQVANSTPYVAHEDDNGNKVNLDLVTIIFEPATKTKAVATKSPKEVADEFIKGVLVELIDDEEEETA